MDHQEAFQGNPWNAKPSEEWNQPTYWDGYYRNLLKKRDSWECAHVIHRDVDLLIRMLTQAGELPRPSAPRTFLDAGCGIAVIPHILAFWGFQVTAIDSCSWAIETAQKMQPTEEELARCISIWEPCKDERCSELVEDPVRSQQRLRSFQAPGGSIRYLACDWFGSDLPIGAFDIVHCRNGLRCSTKPYWRRSLRRFHELLAPGGVLLLEHVNAIGIQPEVEELYPECGFLSCPAGPREPSGKYVMAGWPTG